MAKVWVTLTIEFEVDNLQDYGGDAWEWVFDNVIIGTVNKTEKISSCEIDEVDTDY